MSPKKLGTDGTSRMSYGSGNSSVFEDEKPHILKRIALWVFEKLRNPASNEKLLRVLKGEDRNEITAVHSITCFSTPAKVVFFLGGLWQFGEDRVWTTRIYNSCWAVSFWTCGILCFTNVIYFKQIPFHNLPIDLLTSYVHIPAFLAWAFWRRFLQSDHALRLVQDTITAAPERIIDMLIVGTQVLFFLTSVTMIVMSGVVLIGYAYPGWKESTTGLHQAELNGKSFMWWHAFIMWFVIPPVISGVFCSYCMSIYFAALHVLDIGVFADRLDVIMAETNLAMQRTMLNADMDDKAKALTRQKRRMENMKKNAKLTGHKLSKSDKLDMKKATGELSEKAHLSDETGEGTQLEGDNHNDKKGHGQGGSHPKFENNSKDNVVDTGVVKVEIEKTPTTSKEVPNSSTVLNTTAGAPVANKSEPRTSKNVHAEFDSAGVIARLSLMSQQQLQAHENDPEEKLSNSAHSASHDDSHSATGSLDHESEQKKLQQKISRSFAEQKRLKASQEIFDDAMEEVSLYAQAVQSRLNESCRQWSSTNMHLLVFSLTQVMVVVGNMRLHTIGVMEGRGYTYNWILMDLFHLVGGLVLVVLNMGIGAVVSSSCKARITHLLTLAEQLNVGRTQIAAFMVILQNRIHGYTIWGHPMDAQKCVMISFAFVVLMVNSLCEVLGSKINVMVSSEKMEYRELSGIPNQVSSSGSWQWSDDNSNVAVGQLSLGDLKTLLVGMKERGEL